MTVQEGPTPEAPANEFAAGPTKPAFAGWEMDAAPNPRRRTSWPKARLKPPAAWGMDAGFRRNDGASPALLLRHSAERWGGMTGACRRLIADRLTE